MAQAVLAGEVRRLAFASLPSPPQTEISYGCPFHVASAHYVRKVLRATRVYIIASKTLAASTNNLHLLQQEIGETVVGTSTGIRAHTPLDDLIPIINDIRKKDADCVITIGGGSLADGAQIIALAAANDATTLGALRPFATHHGKVPAGVKPTRMSLVFIPTTLSGAEYSKFGGGTDPETHEKIIFADDSLYARLVVLDPTVTLSMPMRTWVGSGCRAIDHCVEGICSSAPKPDCDVAYADALPRLVRGLQRCMSDSKDEEARLDCMLGCNLSMAGIVDWVPKGASHGIGHQLGPLGVAHGETSCILNPAVMKYNKSANGPQQQKVKDILWRQDVAAEMLKGAGLTQQGSDLGDAMRVLFNKLKMPATLRDVGITGRDKWSGMAENSLRDHMCQTNPVPLNGVDQVYQILEMVEG